jgi:hypothetical protein
MEEKLEALTNIGDLAVSRSNVNMGGNNGGYTWTVTFLRDDDVSGGQFGGCEQKDDANQLCNSPGNVPKFCDAGSCAPNVASMKGSCDNTNVFSSYTPYQTWHSAVPDGKLLGVTVTAGGTGYGSAPAVTIGAPDHWNGIQATATATLTAGVVTSITLTNQGTGYTSVPTVSFASGAAAATAVIQSPPPYGQHFNCSYVTILDAASTLPPPSSVETQVVYLKDPDYAGWDEGTENDNSIEKLYAIEFYGYYSNCLRNTDSATEFGWAFERAFNATQGDTSITEITQLTHYSVNRGTSETLAPNGYVYTINFHGAEGDIADPGTANGLRFHYSLGAQFDATAASVFDFTTNEIIVSALEYAQFITGDEVKYDKGIGGAAITGLVDDRSYFVIKSATANRISLAATKADALAGTPKIGLSVVAGSGTAHWLRSRPFTEMCGESTTPTVISNFDGSDGAKVTGTTITLLAAEYNNLSDGDAITYSMGAGGTVITGLTDGAMYFVKKGVSPAIELHPSKALGGAISLTATAGTAHTISTITKYLAAGSSEPFDTEKNQNILASTVFDSQVHPFDKTTSGCVDGNVHRGNFTSFYVTGDTNLVHDNVAAVTFTPAVASLTTPTMS